MARKNSTTASGSSAAEKGLLPHHVVRQYVSDQIRKGIWAPGAMLPTEVALARRFSVHRLTVNRVLGEFARDGVIVRRRGVGTFVSERPQKPASSPVGKGLVGLVTGHRFDPVSNVFYGAIFEELRRSLGSEGMFLLPLGNADEFIESLGDPTNPMDQLSAIVLLGSPEAASTIGFFESLAIPAIIVGVSEYNGPLASVATDDHAQSAQVAQILIAAGHHQIVHLNAAQPLRMHDRLNGFLEGCDRGGIALPFRYVVEAKGLEMKDGRDAIIQFVSKGLPFTAVACGSDSLALGAISALAEHGYRIPHDVSVTGFDGIEAALHSVPPLATMRLPRREMGREAAKLLLSSFAGKPLPSTHLLIPSEWSPGASIDSPSPAVRKSNPG